MILGASGALWGFGQGNLFARLDSSESMIPGSESDIVLQASGTHGVGEKIIVVVNNGTVPTTHSQLADFRKNVRNLSHVTSVADPETVHAQFEAEKLNASIKQYNKPSRNTAMLSILRLRTQSGNKSRNLWKKNCVHNPIPQICLRPRILT